MRIIDQDIQFYEGQRDHYLNMRRRCMPADESRFTELIQATMVVIDALVAFRNILDNAKPD